MANFCQQVLKPLGSCYACFSVVYFVIRIVVCEKIFCENLKMMNKRRLKKNLKLNDNKHFALLPVKGKIIIH